MIVDLTKDAGFEKMAGMLEEGTLKLPGNLDIDALVEKQAFAEDSSFADPQNRMFSIATAMEADISARYAEKVAYLIDRPVLDAINNACAIFGVPMLKEASAPEITAEEMFPLLYEDNEKYAGVTEYGTELENCLAARALMFPEDADGLGEMLKAASEVSPSDMVSMIQEYDESVGADTPAMQARLGTPEYAVYEKRASSMLSVNLVSKSVPFEKLAEIGDVLDQMGVNIDFDANDAYTTKLAIERLPESVRKAIAKYV